MTNAPIRILVILAAVTLVSIISIQVYWSISAVNSLEQQFSHNVKMSLNNVVESVCQLNGTDVPVRNPVEQVSNAYFIVRTNQPIQLRSLKGILTTEFENRSIEEDFEFGVYDCQHDRMIHGDFVSMTEKDANANPTQLPVLENYDYYFGVYFPQHSSSYWRKQPLLQGTTIATVLIFLFFAYAIFILLKQKRLSAIQRDFINNTMHELKTPVSSLKIASEVLNEETIFRQPERATRYSQLIKSESERLEKYIHQLLRTAELDERQTIIFEPILVNSFIEELVSRLDYRLGKKTIQLDWQENPVLLTDPQYLETILINLIENAIKYGGDIIYIHGKISTKQLIIEISDSGSGIREKDKKRVFQRFYRASTGDTHDVKGFGLGLYIVKKMMEQLKGKVTLVDPEQAKFQLIFPLS